MREGCNQFLNYAIINLIYIKDEGGIVSLISIKDVGGIMIKFFITLNI
jgi:hypothetical protein